mmetsp:Transcript_17870/g.49506  ORF Transcript_17870/g.49506 Transcript_17870/m.49506 type:complete len:101 (+) Transcript_17870:33-335(+)
MGIWLEGAKYPVVDPNPSLNRIINNFSSKDYFNIVAITAVSLPFGYFAGTSRLPMMRGPSAVAAGTIGLMGGVCLALQASAMRLMGRLPNDAEVRKAFRV